MKTFVLLGGDLRQRYLHTFLKEKGFSTYCFGLYPGDSLQAVRDVLRSNTVAAVLPLPVTRDGTHVQMPLTNETLPLLQVVACVQPGSLVAGGIVPKALTESLLQKGVAVSDYYDEDFILKNADLTAEGTLLELRKHISAPLDTLRVAVTGFGRVAKATAKALRAQNCKPVVAARKEEARAEAERAGFSAISIAALCETAGEYDVIINTVPVQILGADALQKTKPGVLLLDVASPPFGVDFAAAEKLKRTAVKALSLPGKYLPAAAAQIVGEKLLSLL